MFTACVWCFIWIYDVICVFHVWLLFVWFVYIPQWWRSSPQTNVMLRITDCLLFGKLPRKMEPKREDMRARREKEATTATKKRKKENKKCYMHMKLENLVGARVCVCKLFVDCLIFVSCTHVRQCFIIIIIFVSFFYHLQCDQFFITLDSFSILLSVWFRFALVLHLLILNHFHLCFLCFYHIRSSHVSCKRLSFVQLNESKRKSKKKSKE